MKLDVVAAVVAAVFLAFPGAALALDGIDLSQPPEETAEGECPRLIQIKYPFIRCADGQIGVANTYPNWENTRRIPRGSDFVEGNSYWGDDLNPDLATD